MRSVVFIGPSLAAAQVREILDAIILPPIRQSDLLSALEQYRPDVVGIVDGAWGQGQHVWHKEILYAMDSGVTVFGAGSVGALCAIDLAPFGMRGVGQVYDEFAHTLFCDDDEVAFTAEPALEEGWRRTSAPLVNIRRLCRNARRQGVLTETEALAIEQAAKQLYYPDRVWQRVCAAARDQGVAAKAIAQLTAFRKSHEGWDVVAADARAMLEEMARHVPSDKPRKANRYRAMQAFRARYDRERHVEQDGVSVPLLSIANHAALHWPDFSEENFNALNRGLVAILAGIMGVEVAGQEVDDEEKRFRLTRRLRTTAEFESWLTQNHMDHHDLRLLMEELALCRKMQRWMVTKKGYFERNTRLLLNQMRLTGHYPEWASRAAEQKKSLDAMLDNEWELPYSGKPLGALVTDHVKALRLRWGVDFVTWATEAGFRPSLLRLELLRARASREYRESLTNPVSDSAPGCADDDTRPAVD